jgi:hypothetical protein
MSLVSARTVAISPLLAVCLLGSSTAAGLEADAHPGEYAVKAAFLYNFARFVEWPPELPPGPFVVAVLGTDPFGSALDSTFANKSIQGRQLDIRRVTRPEDAGDAQVVFIATTEARQLREILKALGSASVLTVGESEGFALAGGIVGFRMSGNRVRFDINLGQASRARLRISSELLKLARVVGAGEAGP